MPPLAALAAANCHRPPLVGGSQYWQSIVDSGIRWCLAARLPLATASRCRAPACNRYLPAIAGSYRTSSSSLPLNLDVLDKKTAHSIHSREKNIIKIRGDRERETRWLAVVSGPEATARSVWHRSYSPCAFAQVRIQAQSSKSMFIFLLQKRRTNKTEGAGSCCFHRQLPPIAASYCFFSFQIRTIRDTSFTLERRGKRGVAGTVEGLCTSAPRAQ